MRRPIFIPVLLVLLIAGLCLTNLSGCAEKNQGTQPTDTEQNESTATQAPEPAFSGTEPVGPSVFPADVPNN